MQYYIQYICIYIAELVFYFLGKQKFFCKAKKIHSVEGYFYFKNCFEIFSLIIFLFAEFNKFINH